MVIICTTCCEIKVLWNWPHWAFYMILPVESDYFPVVFIRNSCSLWGRNHVRGHNLILSMALKGLLLSVVITPCYLNCKQCLRGVCNFLFCKFDLPPVPDTTLSRGLIPLWLVCLLRCYTGWRKNNAGFFKWSVIGRVSFFGVTSNQKSTFENLVQSTIWKFPFAKKLQLCHKKC